MPMYPNQQPAPGYAQPQYPNIPPNYGPPTPFSGAQQVQHIAPPAPMPPQMPQQAAPAPGFVGDPWGSAGVEQRAPRAIDPATGQPLTLPTLRTIGANRLVIVVPTKIERNIRNTGLNAAEKAFINRMTCDLIVLDGQPFMYGGDPTKGTPDQLGPFPIPGVIEGLWINQDGIIDRIKPEEIIGGGFRLGRLKKVQSASGNYPWIFTGASGQVVGSKPGEVSKEAAEAADAPIIAQVRASGVWEAYRNGQLPKVSLASVPNNGYQVTPPQQQAPGNYVAPNGNVQAPGVNYAQPPQGYPAQPVSAPVAPVQPVQPVFAPPAPPVAQAPAQPVDEYPLSALPPDAQASYGPVWASWPPAQRAMVFAQLGVTPPAAAPQGMAPGVGQMPMPDAYAQGPGY